MLFFFCFKQKTAYEMRISDWSSDVCSSDLREGDTAWIYVRIENGHNRNAQRIGFLDCQLFLVGIDDKHDVGDTAHVADTAQRKFKLVTFAGELQHFLLGKAMGIARKLPFKRFEALDRLRNCFPVGEHAAHPAVVAKVLASFACKQIGKGT